MYKFLAAGLIVAAAVLTLYMVALRQGVPYGPEVSVPALPDLAGLDASVAQQIRDAHAALTAAPESPEAFGAFGRTMLATENLPQAAAAFQNAERLAPSDMRWPYYLGHVYRLQQDPARAIPAFERALTLAPSDVPPLIWLGDLHLAGGDAAAAEPYLQRALAAAPGSVAALSRLGRAALARGEHARAIEYLERALKARPDEVGVHYPLGMAYRAAGEAQKAEAHLRQGSSGGSVAPPDPLMDAVAGVLQNAGAFEARGMAALERRDWAAAVENLRRAAALAPQNAVIRLNLGSALSLSGDTPSASRELTEAVRLDPRLAKAHFGLGLIAQDEGRWKDAVEHLSAAAREDDSLADAHFALAEALRRTGRAEESLTRYRRVLELNPAASQARFGHAMALVRLRRYVDARATLTDAVRLHPDQPGLPHALARILAASPDAQARDGARALSLMQPLADTPSAAVSETMGMVTAELGRFEEAVEWQQRAIEQARQAGQGELAARMRDNLALYRQRRPCRTPWRDDDPVIAVVRDEPR